MNKLILIYISLIVTGTFIDVAFQPYVFPEELLKILNDDNSSLNQLSNFCITVLIISIILLFPGLYGLMRSRKYGFKLFAISQFLMLSSIPLTGYYLCSGIGGFFYESSMVVVGMILYKGHLNSAQQLESSEAATRRPADL